MTTRRRRKRHGISLIEMMIATAILTTGAMLVQTLIGNASRLGRKAGDRTMALLLAESAMEESLLTPLSRQREVTETFPHSPDWSYRVHQEPTESQNLLRIHVEVYRTDELKGNANHAHAKPIVSLTRLQRITQAEAQATGSSRRRRP